jgi:hypothetical protein
VYGARRASVARNQGFDSPRRNAASQFFLGLPMLKVLQFNKGKDKEYSGRGQKQKDKSPQAYVLSSK